ILLVVGERGGTIFAEPVGDRLPRLPQAMHRGCRFLLALRFERSHGKAVLSRRLLDHGVEVGELVAGYRLRERQRAEGGGDEPTAESAKPGSGGGHGCSLAGGGAI